MNKKLLVAGTILGILAIVLGAFAAHGLKALVDQDAVKSFETGVRYQMYHAFLLLLIGSTSYIGKWAKQLILVLIIIGLIMFSGSIYGLATNALSSFDFKSIAFITPIGGLILIAAWVVMLIDMLKIKRD